MSESDGIEEVFEGQLRVLVTAATQLGERAARAREAAQRTAAAHSDHEQRELQARFAAEQQVARTQLARVHDSQWWDNAKPEDISAAWQTAKAWTKEDPEAARAEQRITQEIRDRYGISPEDLHNTAEAQRDRAAKDRADAQQLMQQADQQDREADTAREADSTQVKPDGQDTQREAGMLYDSAERREQTAHEMEAAELAPETIDTRMRADVSQGSPATHAVKDPNSRSPKARRTRGNGSQNKQRTGLSK